MTFCIRQGWVASGLSLLALLVPLRSGAAEDSSASRPNPVPALVQPSITYLDLSWTASVYDSSPPVGYLGNGEPIAQVGAQCSGFFVSPNGHVMTASHCTEYGSDVHDALLEDSARWAYEHQYFSGSPTLAAIVRYARQYFRVRAPRLTTTVVWSTSADGSDPKHLPARQLGNRPFLKGDVALLKIGADHTIPLPIATEPVQIGMEVDSVGFPASVDDVTDADKVNPSFKDGEISSKKTIESGLQEVYEVSSAISPGMSGGPTVDSEGRLIGVNSFRPREESQQFNFVSPSSIVDELLKDKGVGPSARRSRDADLLREGIVAVLDGKRNKALDALDEVVDREPDWRIAATYRARALLLPKESTGLPVWLIALIAAGGAMLLAAAAVMLRRRGAPVVPRPAAAGHPSGPGVSSATQVAAAPVRDGDAYLFIGSGSRAGERIPVRGEMSIGRENADLVVDDHEISRRHAVARAVGDGLEISDAGSSNGTFVNGQRIDGPRKLADGDVITVGKTTLTVELPPAAADTESVPILVVKSGSRAGERVRAGGTLTLGRENADVVLEDSEVSRRHAQVRPVDGTLEISDLGSANGTLVNGSRIHSPQKLADGDSITLGKTTLTVELPRPSTATVLSSSVVPETIVDPNRQSDSTG